MFLLFFLLFSLPLMAVLPEKNETAEVDTAVLSRLVRHDSDPAVLHYSQFSHHKVENIILAENIFVRRTIQITPNGMTLNFGGIREKNNEQEYLNPSQAAIYFHALTERYHLLKRTPEQWLAQPGT